jgi:hypothetical protein
MKNQVRIALGRLASIELQRRLCVGGARKEYLVTSEILKSAANAVQTTLASAVLSKQFDASQLKALQEFLHVANTVGPTVPFDSKFLSVEELVENDPEWQKLRTAAQACLDALGLTVSLEELLNRS